MLFISDSYSFSSLHVLISSINLLSYYLVKRGSPVSRRGSLWFFPLGAAFFFPCWPAAECCSGLYDFKAIPPEVAVLKLKLKRKTFLSSLKKNNNNNKTPCEFSAFHVVPSLPLTAWPVLGCQLSFLWCLSPGYLPGICAEKSEIVWCECVGGGSVGRDPSNFVYMFRRKWGWTGNNPGRAYVILDYGEYFSFLSFSPPFPSPQVFP